VDVAAAERPELKDERRQTRRVRGDQPQPVLVEPLEGERVRRDRRRVLDRVRVERVPDRPEQAGDEPGAEEHEDRDPVGRRGEHDGAEQRERHDDDDAERELDRRPDQLGRPPVPGQPGDEQ
jgi:hypothetical protein